METEKIVTLILSKINPISILLELGVNKNSIPHEITKKAEESIKVGKFYIDDKIENGIKFVWKFPFRCEQLIIQEQTDGSVAVWFESNFQPFVIPRIYLPKINTQSINP